MTSTDSAKAAALNWIDRQRQWLSDFHQEIWEYAEPAYREYRSARAYVDLLRREGIHRRRRFRGNAHRFCGQLGSGRTGFGHFAEYDAVPGSSQQAVPYRAPREGLHPWAAGHTDPHSSLGVAALMGLLGAKAAMEHDGLTGTLHIFGEPPRRYAGPSRCTRPRATTTTLDAAVVYHPHTTNTVAWETTAAPTGVWSFTFECLEPEK